MDGSLSRTHRSLVFVALCVLLFGSCGEEDIGGSMTSRVCLEFAPAEPTGPGKVTLQSSRVSGCGTERLEIVLADVTDLYTVSFDVVYDPEIVNYEGYSTVGSILSSDGVQIELLEQASNGRVALGISRVQSDRGVDVGTHGFVVALDFSRVPGVVDSGPVYFENGRLLGSETPPVEKAGVEWFGGVLSIH